VSKSVGAAAAIALTEALVDAELEGATGAGAATLAGVDDTPT